ncbi:MAG: LamG-like jellyroll fold domain-containing protein, partial [Minisyncoccia bacterium]
LSTTIGDANKTLRIGSRDDLATKMKGLIDEVRIYNRALSTTEIKRLYNSAVFTRYFTVNDVYRDASDNIVPSGGTLDPSTQLINVIVNWLTNQGKSGSYNVSYYLSRWVNKTFDQTDWSGGSGQTNPTTQPDNKYNSSSNVDVNSVPGSIKLQGF